MTFTFWLVLASSSITGVVGVIVGYFLGRTRDERPRPARKRDA